MDDSKVKKFDNPEAISKYVEKMNTLIEEYSKKYEDLQQKVDKDLVINIQDLAKEADSNIGKYQNYVWMLTECKRNHSTYKSRRDVLEGELQHYYRFMWDRSTKLSETAIAKYVASHDCLVALTKLVKEQETLVSCLEMTVANFRDRGFAIKNLIELRKMEMGMM
jgi:hypothetical protein